MEFERDEIMQNIVFFGFSILYLNIQEIIAWRYEMDDIHLEYLEDYFLL